jgi:hypothetical protein
MGGSHWCAIYAEGLTKPVFFFDSLAQPIPSIIESSFLVKFAAGTKKNTRPYQSKFAPTCAPHCITFIYYMSLGNSFENFLRTLDANNNGDLFSLNILNKLIGN